VIRSRGILLFAAVDALVLEHYQFDTDPVNSMQDLLADGADAVMQCFMDTYVEPFVLFQPFRGSCNVLQGQHKSAATPSALVTNTRAAIQSTWKKMYSADTATNNDLNATQAAWVLAILHNC
jgi:hypothetical protein